MEKKEEFSKELETQYNILIKAEAKKTEHRFIAVFIIICITLLSTLVSLVFAAKAYFNSKEDVVETVEETKEYYETLSITYNNGNKLDLKEIGTGYSLQTPKRIQITNEGNTDVKFNIKISSIKTSLLATNNLVYTIERENTTSIKKELPLTDTDILKEVTIAPEETITYIIKVDFQGTIEDNSNYYNANIDIIQESMATNLLN